METNANHMNSMFLKNVATLTKNWSQLEEIIPASCFAKKIILDDIIEYKKGT